MLKKKTDVAVFLEISGIREPVFSVMQDAVDRLPDIAERRCRTEHQKKDFQAETAPSVQGCERREPRNAHLGHHEEGAGVGIENGGVARETQASQHRVSTERSEHAALPLGFLVHSRHSTARTACGHGFGQRLYNRSPQSAQQADARSQGAWLQLYLAIPLLQMPVLEVGDGRHAHDDQSVRVFEEHEDGELPCHSRGALFTRAKKIK
jgi:hypothetical protein